ncbi:MAG: LacI family DNA-binding transcriptional regulator [Oscillospiraceae bacterium]|nr:LacI family DNA-binding transcriptional regulator [Oscillospiraceae bacterium]
MTKHVTMQTIADALKVSKVSVSKALNGQPGVSDELRKQILLVAGQVGYKKRPETERLQPAAAFAWLCPKRYFLKDEQFYTSIYYYVNKKLLERQQRLDCLVINAREEADPTSLAETLQCHYTGIFIAGEFKAAYYKEIMALNVPLVGLDFYHGNDEMDLVVIDNFNAGYAVTNELLRAGHRKIGFVGDESQSMSICDRFFGYLKALKLAGQPVKESWHLINNDKEGRYFDINPLPSEWPTAFVCHCDKAAVQLLQQLQQLGLKVPANISLISFDNTGLAELMSPKLSSVDIDKKKIALSALELMDYRLAHPETPFHQIHLDTRIVRRESVRSLN